MDKIIIDKNGHKILISWLGQMGFMIQTGNMKIVIDYFASPDDERRTATPIPADKLLDVDVKYEGRLKCIIPEVAKFE